MQTGKVVWETRVTPTNLPYTITMAPRVIKGGRVIVGASGGEYAVRGFFAAFDANTGKELWKFYTVPGDPSKPFEQPIYAEWAKTWDASKKWWVAGGGGPVWGGVAYDPDEDLVYVGSGQPGPWSSVGRGTGDNLCTDCIIAVKGATGKYVWHYQTTPGDDWDYDSIADITLADLKINGKDRKVLMHAPKNGFVFVIDRTNGQFISAEPWVTVNWASGFDPKTGHAMVNPAAHYGTAASVNITPGPGGGHVWVPWSYNPKRNCCTSPARAGSEGIRSRPIRTIVIQTAEIAGGRTRPDANGNRWRWRRRWCARWRGRWRRSWRRTRRRSRCSRSSGSGIGAGPGSERGGCSRWQRRCSGSSASPCSCRRWTRRSGWRASSLRGLSCGNSRSRCRCCGSATRRRRRSSCAQPGLPFIGPATNGNILVAWNPVTQKEAWRGPANSAAGYNQGGTLTTAGNLVFASVTGCLLAFKADTGEQVLSLSTGLPQSPGPPMTFMLDGKQYIAFAGAIGWRWRRWWWWRSRRRCCRPGWWWRSPTPSGCRWWRWRRTRCGAAAATGPQPAAARLLVLTLDGKPLTP